MSRLFFFLCLSFTASAFAASSVAKDDRVIGFVTQDTNGTHFITIVAEQRIAAVRSGAPGAPHEPRDESYPAARFNSVWQEFQSNSLAGFEVHEEVQHLHIESNFVVMISAGGTKHLFLIAKCSAPPEATKVIEELTRGLLPEGSPGLFRPCEKMPTDPVKPK